MSAIFITVLFILFLIITVVISSSSSFKGKVPFLKYITIIVTIIFLLILVSESFTIIDAGEVGVQVIFGSVQEEPLTEGINFVIPWSDIYRYSARTQEYTMSAQTQEGQKVGDDSIAVLTKDNSEVKVDLTCLWSINPKRIFDIYRNLARSIEEIENIFIRPTVRATVRDIFSKYNMIDTSIKRTEITSGIEKKLMSLFTKRGFNLQQVLLRQIILPKEVTQAIAQKLKRQQEVEEMEFKRQQAVKDAEIKKIEAEGLANAQQIINNTLTPLYIQWKAVENYKDLINSPNTTFVFVPTNPNGTGIPIILDANQKK